MTPKMVQALITSFLRLPQIPYRTFPQVCSCRCYALSYCCKGGGEREDREAHPSKLLNNKVTLEYPRTTIRSIIFMDNVVCNVPLLNSEGRLDRQAQGP